MGNILNGIELGQRAEGRQLFGLTAPLLATSSGAKMGKSTSGAIWLNADRLSAYDFWQFWRNTRDEDVGRFLRLFTELPIDEIERLEALQGNEINESKKRLADEVTALCHGREAAQAARETARQTFEERKVPEGLPTVAVARGRLQHGAPLIDLMVAAGLAASKGEARLLIRAGAVRVNGTVVLDEAARLTGADTGNGMIKLSAGRKRHAQVRVG